MQNDWKVTVAILGARRHYAVPSVLAVQGRLQRFYTDWYLPETGWMGCLRYLLLHLPVKFLRRIAMRSTTYLPDELVYPFPLLGASYALALRMSANDIWREKAYVYFGQRFASLARDAGLGRSAAVYGMNAVSLELFETASTQKVICVLDQCIAPYAILKKELQEEHHLWPGWEIDKGENINLELVEREKKEWGLASLILSGSEYVRDGLISSGVDKGKCFVLPSAVDVNAFQMMEPIYNKNDRLRVLFIGDVGLRKGIQYLYKSLDMIKATSIEVKAVGAVSLSRLASHQVMRRIQLIGLVPRAETYKLWQWADVLVLPSICEGSALVTYEALASGVPVITTPNAGSPVQDGVTGFIVPVRDSVAIAERLDQLAVDSQLRRNMGVAARHFAEEHLSWEVYSKKLLAVLQGAIRNGATL